MAFNTDTLTFMRNYISREINEVEYSITFKTFFNNIILVKNPFIYYNVHTYYKVTPSCWNRNVLKMKLILQNIKDCNGVCTETNNIKYIYYKNSYIYKECQKIGLTASLCRPLLTTTDLKISMKNVSSTYQKKFWHWNLLIDNKFIFKVQLYCSKLKILCNSDNINQCVFDKVSLELYHYYKNELKANSCFRHVFKQDDNLKFSFNIKLISNEDVDAVKTLLLMRS